jgi:hypothetical protein
MTTNFLQNVATEVKSNINSIDVHSQLTHNKHLMDGLLVHLGSNA